MENAFKLLRILVSLVKRNLWELLTPKITNLIVYVNPHFVTYFLSCVTENLIILATVSENSQSLRDIVAKQQH